jgi:pimeloyl-ACP methyl ester carboxylesterase
VPSFTRAGVDLYYEVVGDGPAVVLHTGGAGSGAMWRDGGYVDRLDGFMVVLYDHRGRGRSGRPPDIESHRMPEYVADVSALADDLGLTRFGFVGYSLGGSIGFATAIADRRLRALVTLGCVFEPPTQASVESVAAYDAAVDAVGMDGLIDVIERDEDLTLPDWLRADFRATDPEQFALTGAAMAPDRDPWEALPGLRIPAALIAGGDEDPDAIQDAMAAAMPSATSVHLAGAGHVGAFLRPGEVVAAALPVLRQV